MIIDPKVFKQAFVDRLISRPVNHRGNFTLTRRFQTHFGLNYHQCAVLWNKLYQVSEPEGMSTWKPHHLLDALFFLKVYPAEGIGACFAGSDEKTLRKWNRIVLKAIAQLGVSCVRNKSNKNKLTHQNGQLDVANK